MSVQFTLPGDRKNAPVPSLLQRSLEPLVESLWLFFVLSSLLVALIWLTGIGEAELRHWFGTVITAQGKEAVRNPELFSALNWALSQLDVVWISLGAINVYVSLVAKEGLTAARRDALLVLGCVWLISALSVWTNVPLGPLRFTGRLGFKLGPVSLGWLFLWFSLIFGARELAGVIARRSSHQITAYLTGVLLAASSMPVALVSWKVRAWCLWYPGRGPAPAFPPIATVATWWIVGTLLALVLREQRVARTADTMPGRPSVVFLITIGLFVAILGWSAHA
jgi:hypothetical protein